MISIAFLFVRMLCDCFKSRRRLKAEILVLRHQLNILQQRAPRRLHLRWADRAIFIWLYRRFPRILDAITSSDRDGCAVASNGLCRTLEMEIASPATDWQGGARSDPKIELREPAVGCSQDPRRTAQTGHQCRAVHGFDLHGVEAGPAVAELENVPLQSWKEIASIDLFVVPTIAFRRLFVCLVLGHQ